MTAACAWSGCVHRRHEYLPHIVVLARNEAALALR
jgi:hypothetical protein